MPGLAGHLQDREEGHLMANLIKHHLIKLTETGETCSSERDV